MTRPCIRNCTINYTLSIVNSYRAYLVIKYQTLHYLLLILVGNAANDGNILKNKNISNMLFHHSLEDALQHLQICMLPCFCSKSFRQFFICTEIFPSLAGNLNRSMGKVFLRWSCLRNIVQADQWYTHVNIYIWQCVKTLYPWWTST